MIELPNVTLVAVNGYDTIEKAYELEKSLRVSSRNINFGDIKLLTAAPIQSMYEICDIPKLTWMEYNDFMLRELVNYVDTDFVITIQEDGFIINSNLWIDEFLQYDYIGAPWNYEMHFGPNSPQYCPSCMGPDRWIHHNVRRKPQEDVNLVGNGGFSLRSKKLLRETANCPFDNLGGPEDAYICVNYYEYFVDRGVKFAPLELASKFSLNIDMYSDPLGVCKGIFGFHGDKKMLDKLS